MKMRLFRVEKFDMNGAINPPYPSNYRYRIVMNPKDYVLKSVRTYETQEEAETACLFLESEIVNLVRGSTGFVR